MTSLRFKDITVKSKSFAEMTDEGLKSKQKTLRAILSVLVVVSLIYAAYVVYRLATGQEDGKIGLKLIPISSTALCSLPITVQLGGISKELKKRQVAEGWWNTAAPACFVNGRP